MMQINQGQVIVTQQSITNCFLSLYDSSASPLMRRNANQQLLQFQAQPIDLLANLLAIFQQNPNDGLRLQALVYFCNVLKRNWLIRRYNKEHSEFQVLKKDIQNTILQQICLKDRRYLKTLFDMTRFIAQKDYPQNFPTFTQFVHKMLDELELNETTVVIFKQLRQIFYDIGQRKGSVSKKLFEQHLRSILNSTCSLSVKLKDAVLAASNDKTLSSALIKLSKYMDQIVIYILRVAPSDIMDESFSKDVTQFLHSKLQQLLSCHNSANKNIKPLLQKNIKSLIFDLGLLQLSKPLMICWILKDFFSVLIYVLQNYQIFIKNEPIRYALIGLRRIVKQFSYYGEDSAFMSSIKSKTMSSNCLELRKICSSCYKQMINERTVQQLFNYLLFNPFNRSSKEYTYFDLEQGVGVDRGKQKELGIQACVILLIEGLMERFTPQTHALLTTLIFNSMQSNWSNLDKISINNILSVIAILPSSYKKNELHRLKEIPVLQILQFIYTSAFFKIKFAKIVSGWIDAFSNEQLNSLNGVLLDFIHNEGQGDIDDSALELLMSCCQCLNKVVMQRASAIDLRTLVQRILPISLQIFQNIDNPQILWPMINLISNIIVKVEFDAQLIVNSVDPSKLSLLISNQSTMLVQALCEMFKSFLCVIPRNMVAKSVYELVCYFLNNHLSEFSSVNHEKIFHLWYISIREYSPIQNCESLYVDLFLNHFRKNMYRKTATLVYILQEYLLSGLIPNSIDNFISLAVDCYTEAQQLQKEERQKLKIATLSFQITLITKFNLEQVNSDRLLQLILQDLANPDVKVITPTIRNSILSILNRYIILHQQSFFSYLNNLNIPIEAFLELYFNSMEFLTSNTANKINAIALLSLINNVDSSLIIPRLHFLLRLAIPEVQRYNGTLQTSGFTTFIGKVDNSPSLRFASNTLSQRKEEVRKLDVFDQIDLRSIFRAQVGQFLRKSNISAHDVAVAFNEQVWSDKFLKLL